MAIAIAPRPIRSAWPFLALGVLALLLDADPRLPWLAGVATASCFLVAAGVRGARAYLELRSLRRAADVQILRGVRTPYADFVGWRAHELEEPSARRRVRRPLGRLIGDLESVTLPGAAPVNRVLGRRHLAELRELYDLLDGECSARGLLLLDQFLTSPGSPLYARERAAAFERALLEIKHELYRNRA
jgi:hypothetical protein